MLLKVFVINSLMYLSVMRKRTYTSLECDVHVPSDASAPVPLIHNIVCTAKLQCSHMPLDLNVIHTLIPCSVYDQRRFAAMTVRLAHPFCTVLLFSSGKMVVTGGKHWYDCVLCSLIVTDMLRQCLAGQDFKLVACEIQNIVAHVEIPLNGGQLNLEAMYNQMNLYSTYQKSMFPGLIYRPPSSPVVLLCFDSGKIVITGGKTSADIHCGWGLLWPVVKLFVSSGTSFKRLKSDGSFMSLDNSVKVSKTLPDRSLCSSTPEAQRFAPSN